MRSVLLLGIVFLVSCSDGSGDAGGRCVGLGCPECESLSAMSESGSPLCYSNAACDDATPCAQSFSPECLEESGTLTLDRERGTCVAGTCLYAVAANSCVGIIPCDDCATSGRAQACWGADTAADCASCCGSSAAAGDAEALAACACGDEGPCTAACGTTTFCGGADAPSDECASCLASTLLDDGACITSAAFQGACIDGDGSCRQVAQCLVTCSTI